jgi:hypothetical protein
VPHGRICPPIRLILILSGNTLDQLQHRPRPLHRTHVGVADPDSRPKFAELAARRRAKLDEADWVFTWPAGI